MAAALRGAPFQAESGRRLLRRDTATSFPSGEVSHEHLRFPEPELCPKKALALLAAAVPRRSVGNWVAAVSEASLSTSYMTGAPSQGKSFDTDYHDCEPELVRITSLESEANSEALLRLFGRKAPPVNKKPAALSQVCEEETESPLKREATISRPSPACTSPAAPSLVQGPHSPDVGGTDGDGQQHSPRGSVDSASCCHGGEAGEVESERCSTPGKTPAHPASVDCTADEFETQATERVTCGADPTCAVDLYSWCQQSLQSILATEPSEYPLETESGMMTPRAVLESSVLDLISDPVVKAKIRSLQLFTNVAFPIPCSGDEFPGPVEGDSTLANFADECHGEVCASPDGGEDSPPPLERRFTGKRDSVFEDCWLTGEQRRRKASAVCDTSDHLFDDAFKRRRF